MSLRFSPLLCGLVGLFSSSGSFRVFVFSSLPDVDLRELLRDVFYQASVELHLTSQFKPLLHQTHPIHTTPMVHSTQSDKNSRHSTLTVLNTNHSQGQTLDDSFGGI